MKIPITLVFLFSALIGYSQGHIDHIKNQAYLKNKNQVKCDQIEDNLSARICANLAYQKSDSILVEIYDSLLLVAKDHYIDSLAFKIEQMQTTWRAFRDQHCSIIYDSYEGGSMQGIAYLDCLKELTDDRIKELQELMDQIQN